MVYNDRQLTYSLSEVLRILRLTAHVPLNPLIQAHLRHKLGLNERDNGIIFADNMQGGE